MSRQKFAEIDAALASCEHKNTDVVIEIAELRQTVAALQEDVTALSRLAVELREKLGKSGK
jgi:hypothetical protein